MKYYFTIFFAFMLLNNCNLSSQPKKIMRMGNPSNSQKITDIEINNTLKEKVVESLIQQVNDYYVFPEKTKDIEDFLRKVLKEEKYQLKQTAMEFSRELTADLRVFANERHLGVLYEPENFEMLAERTSDLKKGERMRTGGKAGVQFGEDTTEEEMAAFYDSPMMRRFTRNTFNMRKIEVLEGNVGYFKINQIPPLELAKDALDAAMIFLSHCDAMIIDLRGNTGGIGGFNPYWMSYFFEEEGKLLFERAMRDTTYGYYTQAVEGIKMPEKPLFLLTSNSTGSAAENITFTLKHHQRAKTVGEATGGAAHSAMPLALTDGFTAIVAVGRLKHPLNDVDFEGIGVQPDIEVGQAEALKVAHIEALKVLLETKAKPYQLQEWRETLQALETDSPEKGATVKVAEELLKKYIGQYGIRTISLEFGKLRYLREGGMKLDLEAVDAVTFRLKLPEGVMARNPLPDVRFDQNKEGKITGFTMLHPNGKEEFIEKNK